MRIQFGLLEHHSLLFEGLGGTLSDCHAWDLLLLAEGVRRPSEARGEPHGLLELENVVVLGAFGLPLGLIVVRNMLLHILGHERILWAREPMCCHLQGSIPLRGRVKSCRGMPGPSSA